VSVIDGKTDEVTAVIPAKSPISPGAGGVAVDPRTDTIYVGAGASHTGAAQVDVLDGKTDKFTAEISVGSGGEDIGVNRRTDMIYVSNFGGGEGGRPGTVNVINGKNNKVVATLLQARPAPAAELQTPRRTTSSTLLASTKPRENGRSRR
jgi:DNA-binding beta-propeller fold protein YncE